MAVLIDNPSVGEFELSHNDQAWVPLHSELTR